MNLQVVFHYMVNTLRAADNVRDVRVMDEGAFVVSQSPHGFDEDIAVYLLAGELSVEFIKKAVNGNTRSDIHTLFIISSDLLPPDGASAQSDEGLRLLLDLYGGKVYAYHVDAREVTIFPVFVGTTVTYGKPVNIGDISSDYAELRTSKHIRGFRKIAGFTAQHSQSSSSSSSNAAPRRVYDPLKQFYDLLDVPLTASEDEIKKAYRQKARQHHPDADPSPDATTKMQAINEAYGKIIKRFNVVK
jgi:DnaJ-like protein